MKLKLPNGLNYFTDGQGKQVCRGAKLGHCNQVPEDLTAPVKLHLEKLRIDSGGYDKSGAYWGLPGNEYVYCAWHDDIFVFKWAKTRDGAKSLVRGILPNATFFH